jgi:hypothetical protein
MAKMYGMELERVIEILQEMLLLARDNRCVYCSWPLDGSSCTLKRCSFIPKTGSYEDIKMRERLQVMGFQNKTTREDSHNDEDSRKASPGK